ncbi:MAG: N-acetylmuramoyl-L-alanine amidase [Balneolales bacterium]|nr:N-acetylmuramoyl-L-alanine amidase [Balneolales bacterium]
MFYSRSSLYILNFFTFLLFSAVLFSSKDTLAKQPGVTLLAENTLERISTATRSDGLGYVIRFHFTAAPDSFRIYQAEPGLIQAVFYDSRMQIRKDNFSYHEPIMEITSHEIPGGTGFNIRLAENAYYRSRIYPDRNQRHLLIGLTEASPTELQMLTEGFFPINWQELNSATVVENPSSDNAQSDQQNTPSSTNQEAVTNETQSEQSDNGDATNTNAATVEPETPSLQGTNEDDFSDSFNSIFEVNRSGVEFTTIVLDPGHGGRDPGAIGFSGSYEKDIALSVAKRVGAYINEYMPDMRVVYTRDDDTFVGLAERGRIANRYMGHLFVSIHTNSHTGRQANGAEVYFLGIGRTSSALEVMKRENAVIQLEDESDRTQELSRDQLMIYEIANIGNQRESERFGQLVMDQFSNRAQRRSRGVKQAGLQVLFEAAMPGVLIELGFISNPEEERFMKSEYGQNILASAIFRAIRDYKEIREQRFNTRITD